MPQYYFDVRDTIPVRDRVGAQLTNDSDAISFANKIADGLRDQKLGIDSDWYVSVVNENGSEIAQIKLSHNVEAAKLN